MCLASFYQLFYWPYPTIFWRLSAFYLLVVQSNYLVHVNKCVNFLLTNNVLCLVVPMWGNFISMLYQGEHVGRVSGRYSDVMSKELLLNINHRLASNSFMLSPGLSELLIEFQEKALSLVVIAILQGSLMSWKLAYFGWGLARIEGGTGTTKWLDLTNPCTPRRISKAKEN